MTCINWQIIHKEQTGSTSDDVRLLARAGASEGTVIVAREQVSGRGQWGRVWKSPLGGLYFSCILKPALPQVEWPALSPQFAQAVKTGIENVCALQPGVLRIKEPNDIVCDDGKVCGILLDAFDGTTIVMGCGINVFRPFDPVITDGRNIPAYLSDYVNLCEGGVPALHALENLAVSCGATVPSQKVFLDALLRSVLEEISKVL